MRGIGQKQLETNKRKKNKKSSTKKPLKKERQKKTTESIWLTNETTEKNINTTKNIK